LLDAAIARARAWPGVEQIQLAVMTENAPARRLYLAAGFEVFGLERRALRVGDRYVDEEHMVLHL
jgi:RimJ/RimL family protein N-acetyltransferase